MFDIEERKRKVEIIERIEKGGNLFKIANEIISQEKAMIEQAIENENERAFRALAGYGIPKERAKSVSNGIRVLVTRMDKEIAFLKLEKEQAKKEAVKEFAEKLFGMGLVGFPEEVNKLLKEYDK